MKASACFLFYSAISSWAGALELADKEKSRSGCVRRLEKASLMSRVTSLVRERACLVQSRIDLGSTSKEPRVLIPQRSSKMFMQILSLDFVSFSSLLVASTIGLEEETPSIK